TDLTIHFPTYYTAICGKNDSGKSNVLSTIRTFFEESGNPFFNDQSLSIKRDLPRWIPKDSKDKKISLTLSCTINRNQDAGAYLFLEEYLKIDKKNESETLEVVIKNSCSPQKPEGEISVEVVGNALEEIKGQEVLNKL